MKLKPVLAALAAFIISAAVMPAEAQAQAGRRCLVTASSPPGTATYDPFDPAALTLGNVHITFTRLPAQNGAKAAILDFYVRSTNPGANNIVLTPISAVGAGNGTGFNQDIFYGTNETPPMITVPLGNSPIPGVFRWQFNGANDASDVFTVTFNIQLPQNLNLEASGSILFDIEYGCNGTGGGPQFSELGTAPNAFTLNIDVRSALQASYVGSALDFGEVGDRTDSQITPSSPLTVGGDIRVASSGPYTISLASQNNYRLTYPLGDVNDPIKSLDYRANFLGQTAQPGSTTVLSRTCTRAGLGSPPLSGGQLLPISVDLVEGGQEEIPASYRDVLTVTVAPLAAATPGVLCG